MGEETVQQAKTQQSDEAREKKMPGSLAELLAELDKEGIDQKRYLQAIDKYLLTKSYIMAVPINGSFELTPLCNFNCRMCYVHLTTQQLHEKKLLTIEQWKCLLKQAVDAGMLYAKFTGGECLTYYGFKELYMYAFSLGIKVTVMSNGLLINDEMIELFKKYPPRGVIVTIYGNNDDVYERITGKRVFSEVWNNVKKIKQSLIPISISITPSKYLGEDAFDLIRLVSTLNIDFSINSGLFDPRIETGRNGQNCDVDLDTYMQLVKLQIELGGYSKLHVCDKELPPIGGNSDQIAKGLKCSAGRNYFEISWDGIMHPCSMLRTIEAYPLDNSFSSAWNTIHESVLEYYTPQECIGCPYKDVCSICVVEHAQDAPIGHASTRICERGKRMVKEGIAQL